MTEPAQPKRLGHSTNADAEWSLNYALAAVDHGTKTDLKRFSQAVLARACAAKGLNDPSPSTLNKKQLIATLDQQVCLSFQ